MIADTKRVITQHITTIGYVHETKPETIKRLSRPNTKVVDVKSERVKNSYGNIEPVITWTLENDLVRVKFIVEGESSWSYLKLDSVEFLKPITDKTFEISETLVIGQHDEREGLMDIGLPNDSKRFLHLREINGVSIEEIEQRMRPRSYSSAGFLGKEENFLDVLVKDNETIQKYGLSHQDVGRILDQFRTVANFSSEGSLCAFVFNGQKLEIGRTSYLGSQKSPFGDGTDGSSDYFIRNIDNGKTVRFSMLHPEMVHNYGFYEGEGTLYRLDPDQLMETLGIQKEGERDN